MIQLRYLIVVSILITSCKSTSEFTGFSYDPPDVTNTTGKTIIPQKQRIIGAGTPKVWVSNEFEAARAVDFYQVNENTFEVLITPENFPINNSPWYAFDIWGDEARAINLRLKYKEGEHRYLPKIYRQTEGLTFSHIIQNAEYDSATGSASFRIFLEETPQRISAHFLEHIRFSDLVKTISAYNQDFISIDTVGYSNEKRPILQITVDETADSPQKGVLVLLSRQHPPEVSSYRTYQYFFNTLISDTPLARDFRKEFIVKSFPMVNPDGVVNGHWRHNARGVDLNRDWKNFNQPETQAVRDALILQTQNSNLRVMYGIDFHSTNENIFYPINEDVKTIPDNLTQRWFPLVDTENPELHFVAEEFDTSSPIAKNWLYREFGIDALTFEVHDELDIESIRQLGVTSAESLMRLLLEEWKEQKSNN
ncbi:MAG: M14 family metallopeptidase [Balneolales bacterium]|nr:M14 family metallopeptidase [Balneolales bacterium]